MLRLFALFVFIALVAFSISATVWYFKTPQPIGPYAQWEHARQLVTYEYYDYKKPKDADELTYWLPMAQKGNALAQTHVAELYFQAGVDNTVNYEYAVQFLAIAANKGLPSAQNALGVALRKGLGIQQDKVEAYKWFSLAARQGYLLAKQNLQDINPELSERERDQAKLSISLWLKNIKKF